MEKMFDLKFQYDQRVINALKTLPSQTRRWNPQERTWQVSCSKLYSVAEVIEPFLPELSKELREGEDYAAARVEAEIFKEILASSRAHDANIDIPAPEGQEYREYQKAGVAYTADRKVTLMADEMGLGKTIQVLGAINLDLTIKKVLVICPASLRLNWFREATKWLVRKMTIGFVEGGQKDSFPKDNDIVIINYDVLKQHHKIIRSIQWDLLAVDECHYLKNQRTIRTQQVFGKWAKDPKDQIEPIIAKKYIFMTGTPIVNRPIELWPLLNFADSQRWRSWKYYVKKFCEGTHNGYGWDTSGASNLEELQEILRSTIMIRRLKKDVLTELPPKRRQVIEMPADGVQWVIDEEQASIKAKREYLDELRARVELAKASEDEEEYRSAVKNLNAGKMVAFTEIAALRHKTALAKVPYVIEHLREAIDSSGKVIVYGHHRDVLEAIYEAFKDQAVLVYGGMKIRDKDANIEKFQTNSECKLFVGSILQAVGITLTASSHEVFCEIDWVPGNMNQAEDRAHRIGQEDSLLIQHLVLEGSIDAEMSKLIVEKQEKIDRAMDTDFEAHEQERVQWIKKSGYDMVSRDKLGKIADKLMAEQVEAIHEGLMQLAGMCDGARAIDGMGFNKIDTFIGKKLAVCPQLSKRQAALGYRIIKKYQRQFPEEIYKRIYTT